MTEILTKKLFKLNYYNIKKVIKILSCLSNKKLKYKY